MADGIPSTSVPGDPPEGPRKAVQHYSKEQVRNIKFVSEFVGRESKLKVGLWRVLFLAIALAVSSTWTLFIDNIGFFVRHIEFIVKTFKLLGGGSAVVTLITMLLILWSSRKEARKVDQLGKQIPNHLVILRGPHEAVWVVDTQTGSAESIR